MTEKRCRSCGETKVLDFFHKNKNGELGRHNYCKLCRSSERKRLSYPRPNDGTSHCPDCGETKDISMFSSDRSATSGLQTYCKACQRIRGICWASTFGGYITRVFLWLQNNAKKRNLRVEITREDIAALYHEQEGKCALTGLQMTHVYSPTEEGGRRNERNENHLRNFSVDRKDSSGSYTKENIQLVCGIINTIKWDLPQHEFIFYCKAVTKYHDGLTSSVPTNTKRVKTT